MRPDWPEADYERIAANIVSQVRRRGATIPVINSITHNDNDYTDPDDGSAAISSAPYRR